MSHLDASLFRAMNRLADRTSWAHGAMVAYAKVGIVAFAAMLVLGWWRARSGGDIDVMARVLWAGVGAVVALGLNQVIGDSTHKAAKPMTTLARSGTLGSVRSRRATVTHAGRKAARSLRIPGGSRRASTTRSAHEAISTTMPPTTYRITETSLLMCNACYTQSVTF